MARFLGCDYEVKIVLVGDSGVGKTCLLLRLAEDSFPLSFAATVGVDMKVKQVEVDGKQVKLRIWDTAGQERYKSVAQPYYRSADGVLIAFDCTDEDSFNNVTKWLMEIDMFADPGICKVLISTKSDRLDRCISIQQGEALARELEMQYFETSAKTNVNVMEAFQYLAKEIGGGKLGPQDTLGVKVTHTGEKKQCC